MQLGVLIRMFLLITLGLHQLMKLIFFHQLIKIQDNDSKHARSNSLQDWREDVKLLARIFRRNHKKHRLLSFILTGEKSESFTLT